ncbi:chemosensory receptor B [Elysia marginata]|uniref:Chemosensory receptor B n=1 Tax=Elysia marginata TaxID=1093978 RepID=A0AAV4G491_9GAST|nr:chemosensory receptor B [Elysia marginata]
MDPNHGFNTSEPSSSLNTKPRVINGILFQQLMVGVLALDLVTGMLATAANIITIIVYKKLGFENSTNVSLTALAISDLGGGITTIVSVMAYFLHSIPNVRFTYEIFTAFAPYPHLVFSRLSALITTYISVERYLCVTLPLKIKSIITTRRTFVAMSTIFVFSIGMNLHLSLRFPIGWKFYPDRNKTLLGVVPCTNRAVLAFHGVRTVIFSSILPAFTASTAVLTTILLSVALQKNKKWRDANKSVVPASSGGAAKEKQNASSSSSSSNPLAVDSKEARAVKMTTAITTVFIVSSIPSIIHQLVTMAIPEFEVDGRYQHMYVLTGMSFLMVDCINCSANVIIYYKMSSKFRSALTDKFGLDSKK